MPAMLKDEGSCPICARNVPRLLATLRGRMREIYTCPDHGAVAYGASNVTVQEWNELGLARQMKQVVEARAVSTLEAMGVPMIAPV